MARTLMAKIWDALEERFEFAEALEKQFSQTVPSHATTWPYCLGGLAFFAFVIQVASGILLLFYYKPTVAEAYRSIDFIMKEVPYGWFVRSLHSLGANLFIALIILHMVRVFVTGSYKKPREFHWVSGVIMFLLALAFGFTGYLLPWDQVSYWATTVGTEITRSLPPQSLGHFILVFLRGGEQVSGDTLTRFFAMHVWFLPVLMLIFMALHFLMIRKTGISGPL